MTVEEIQLYLQNKVIRYNNDIKKLEKYLEEHPESMMSQSQLMGMKWIRKDTVETYNDLFGKTK
ncbi:hypothetical protein [Enterococcus phage vB_OCPT_SDS2]|nr:hypothetical protein [Enterococcus phage vB_OCPT_SDS2]UQT01499.1 hypothetical protein KMDAMLD_00027 [Enterococcus phage vB_OCPT_PG11]